MVVMYLDANNFSLNNLHICLSVCLSVRDVCVKVFCQVYAPGA